MKKADEPVFSRPYSELSKHDGRGTYEAQKGLTKREYFAGLAMKGLLSTDEYVNDSNDGRKAICKHAIELADELLKQLEA